MARKVNNEEFNIEELIKWILDNKAILLSVFIDGMFTV